MITRGGGKPPPSRTSPPLFPIRTLLPMRRSASVGILFFTVFLDLLGFGMVLPLMPLYAADPRFHASPVEIGWLMAIYSIMQFLFAPSWGRLSDRIGRRPVLIVGLFGSCFSYLAYGFAESFTVLIITRALAGISGANIAAAQAAMADITPREERTKAMGLIGAAFGLGFVLGPALGGIASSYGLHMAPLLAAAITGINAIFALFLLGETHHPSDTQKNSTGSIHPLLGSSWRLANTFPGAMRICLIMGFYTALFSAFEVTLPLWGHASLGWTVTSVGWVFVYVGAIAVIIQGGFVRRFAARIGEKRTVSIGLLLVAVGLSFFAMGGLYTALLALGLIAAGSGMVHPGLSSLASLNTNPEQQGMMMGLFQSMNALGRSIGPVVGGLLYALFGGMVFPITAVGLFLLLLAFIAMQKLVVDGRETVAPAASQNVP